MINSEGKHTLNIIAAAKASILTYKSVILIYLLETMGPVKCRLRELNYCTSTTFFIPTS
jgi:hypothetical protein